MISSRTACEYSHEWAKANIPMNEQTRWKYRVKKEWMPRSSRPSRAEIPDIRRGVHSDTGSYLDMSRLAINLAIVGDCFLRNSLRTNAAILYLVYHFLVKDTRRDAGFFSLIVIIFAIKLYPFFCRSPYRQISNFLFCNLVDALPYVAKVGIVWRKVTQPSTLIIFASLELKFHWILKNKFVIDLFVHNSNNTSIPRYLC